VSTSTHSPNEFVSGYQERFLIAIKVDLAFDPIAPTANIESIIDRSKAKSINLSMGRADVGPTRCACPTGQ
jgi:hypothetical protein